MNSLEYHIVEGPEGIKWDIWVTGTGSENKICLAL
jgi:hypothetical protein